MPWHKYLGIWVINLRPIEHTLPRFDIWILICLTEYLLELNFSLIAFAIPNSEYPYPTCVEHVRSLLSWITPIRYLSSPRLWSWHFGICILVVMTCCPADPHGQLDTPSGLCSLYLILRPPSFFACLLSESYALAMISKLISPRAISLLEDDADILLFPFGW